MKTITLKEYVELHTMRPLKKNGGARIMIRRERNHFYVYTVDLRTEDGWVERIVAHCANMHEVAGKLRVNINDVRYKHKEIER